MLLRAASLLLALPRASSAADGRCSAAPGDPLTAVETPFEIYQDSSGGENWQSTNHLNRERRVPVQFRGYRVRSASGDHSGMRATPVVSVRRDDAVVTAAVPHFWQNFPKAVEADDRRLTWRIFPGQFSDVHELQPGEQKTHECWLAFGPDAATALEGWALSPAAVCPSPDWTLASGADSTAPGALPLAPFRGALEWPAAGPVRHRFGWAPAGAQSGSSANGIEIVSTVGAPVRAIHDGTVAFADTFSGYGKLVIVDHGSQTFSLYGHLLDISVARGDRVQQGQPVGAAGFALVGVPGLYFELRIDGRPVDPLQWLKAK